MLPCSVCQELSHRIVVGRIANPSRKTKADWQSVLHTQFGKLLFYRVFGSSGCHGQSRSANTSRLRSGLHPLSRDLAHKVEGIVMTGYCVNNEALYSPYGGDPDLAELVELFVQELPLRIQAAKEAVSGGNWLGLARLAHQLKGAAGSYGFHQLTPHAMHLESVASVGANEALIREALHSLEHICLRCRSGVSDSGSQCED